jgi:hypothetical protein
VIVVRAARRPGQGPDGYNLCRQTLAAVDREGGHGESRVLVIDGEPPEGGIPDRWRTVVTTGPRGARASLWAAMTMCRGYTRRTLFLEDDIELAPFATDAMLAADLRSIPLCSFFYPMYAQRHERKPRRPGMEIWNIHQFGCTQAFLMSPSALDKVIKGEHWPAPPMGGPHGGDGALRSALFRAGYDSHGVLWPNLVDHTGVGESSIVEPRATRIVRSGWFAGEEIRRTEGQA